MIGKFGREERLIFNLTIFRDNSDFPELFRPFKNLLRKIRDLLLTLSLAEFHVLEKLLCQLEEPSDLERKLKVKLRVKTVEWRD